MLIATAWFAPFGVAQAGQPIVIGDGFESAAIEGSMDVLRDPGGKLGLSEIAFGEAAARFSPIAGPLAAGYTPDVFWVRIPVIVRGVAPLLMIDMVPAYLDTVRVFIPRIATPGSAADFDEVVLGDHTQFAERATITPSLATPVSLPANLAGEVYIRLQTSSTVALRGAIRTPTSMATSVTIQSLQLGLFQGIFLITGVANLLFWWRLRDRTYMVYAAFILNQAALSWCKSGLVPAEWMPGGASGVDYLLGVMMFASQGIGALFASVQTNSKRLFPAVHLVFLAVASISVFGIVMTLLGYYQILIGPALSGGIIVCILALGCNLVQVRRRVTGSVLATTAIVFQIGGVLIASLMLNAQIPYSGWMDYSFETGSIFFIIYMTLSLAQRAHTSEAERRLAQAEALSVALASEHYALELVDRRTRELAAAKDLAEAALQAEHETQLEQIRFVDVISHQYRTPLAVISSTLAAFRMDLKEDDAKNRDRLDRARRAIERLVEIIEVNGHRSRLQGVAAKAELAPVAIGPFMERLIARSRDMFGDRGIDLVYSANAAEAVAHLDIDLTELALVNLIENADKFSPPGPPIAVHVSCKGAAITFSVTDKGIGIPEEERDLLTRKFFRASNSGGTSGLGLGLHIVKTAAAAHGGDVVIDSTEGEGTTVSLTVAGAV